MERYPKISTTGSLVHYKIDPNFTEFCSSHLDRMMPANSVFTDSNKVKLSISHGLEYFFSFGV